MINNTQLACYALLASALVLGGLLLTRLTDGLATPAQASNVISKDNFTLLTAKTRADEEALFVLSNRTGRLLIYELQLGDRRLELVGGGNMREVFGRP